MRTQWLLFPGICKLIWVWLCIKPKKLEIHYIRLIHHAAGPWPPGEQIRSPKVPLSGCSRCPEKRGGGPLAAAQEQGDRGTGAQWQLWSLLSAYCVVLQLKWAQWNRFSDDIIQFALNQPSKTGHTPCTDTQIEDKPVKWVHAPNKETADLTPLLFLVEVLLQPCMIWKQWWTSQIW